jgi:hypothetical protein
MLVNKVDHLGVQGRRCRRDLRIADTTQIAKSDNVATQMVDFLLNMKGAQRQDNAANLFRHYETVARLRADGEPTLRKAVRSSELR